MIKIRLLNIKRGTKGDLLLDNYMIIFFLIVVFFPLELIIDEGKSGGHLSGEFTMGVNSYFYIQKIFF